MITWGKIRQGLRIIHLSNLQNEYSFTAAEFKEEGNRENVRTLKHNDYEDTSSNTNSKEKRKRKRKTVVDLRFQNINQGTTTTGLSKRERRKK